jgi:hypothetical protein
VVLFSDVRFGDPKRALVIELRKSGRIGVVLPPRGECLAYALLYAEVFAGQLGAQILDVEVDEGIVSFREPGGSVRNCYARTVRLDA